MCIKSKPATYAKEITSYVHQSKEHKDVRYRFLCNTEKLETFSQCVLVSLSFKMFLSGSSHRGKMKAIFSHLQN